MVSVNLLPTWSRIRPALLALALMSAGSVPAQAASVPRPSSAVIRTMDLDETVSWYRDKLGFRVVSDQTRVQSRTVVLERSGFLLELDEDDQHTLAGPGPDVDVTGNIASPAVSVLVPDVDAEVERLRSENVEILSEPQDELDGRFRVSLIQDNGDQIVELREPLGSGADFHAEGR